VVGSGTGPRPAIECLVGEDAHFRAALDLAQRAAPWDAAVVVTGESGTGKELVARLIHESSRRATGPFVAINCGAIAHSLIESELFGHERGSFTGAEARHAGVFEQAQGGTLFLDEIGELSREHQPRLLRAIESRRIRRIGGDREIEVDVRIVTATHRDLRAAAVSGDFRLDLYHRLCGVEIRLPPLRERPGDIPLLVATLLAQTADGGEVSVSADTLAALARHTWPGNVRELANAVKRAALLGDGELRLCDMLPPDALRRPAAAALAEPVPWRGQLELGGVTLAELNRQAMEQALGQFGSLRRAAASLGVSKSTFHDRARRMGLVIPRGVIPVK
jgi:two-component system, NtrC family, response regulator HydG